MRNMNEIINDMIILAGQGDPDRDPELSSSFKLLLIEYYEARGNIVLETVCPQCGDILDKDEANYRSWEFEYVNQTPSIKYICSKCDVSVPMNMIKPDLTQLRQ